MSQRAAFASGTQSNLRVQWRSFLLFCHYFHIQPIPADLDIICMYVQFLSQTLTIQSIRNYLNGVKLLHLYVGAPFPHIGSFELTLLLKGLARLNPHTPKQALPITPPILLKLLAHLQLSCPLHASLWSAILLGFFLFARKSNLVPPSPSKFHPLKHLTRGSVAICPAGLLVTLRWSKTIQCGDRVLRIPVVAIPNSPLCPLHAWYNMTSLVPAEDSSPAFIYPSPTGLLTLTYYTFTSNLRKLLQLAGFNPSAYSGHSLRRGGATWAFKSKVPGELIQLHGDWSSDAYLRYLDFSLEGKMTVSSLMKQTILLL